MHRVIPSAVSAHRGDDGTKDRSSRWGLVLLLGSMLMAAARPVGAVPPSMCSPNLPEQCTPADVCALTDDGNFRITLLSAVYDGNANVTTFTYRVCGVPPTQDLSHWVLGLVCTDDVVPSNLYSIVTPDPTTCLEGVKFETPAGVADCVPSTDCAGGAVFSIVLAGNVGVAPLPAGSTIATKAGELVETACVQGPDCCTVADQCDDDNPCTVDSCSGNVCSHTPLVCADDGNQCTTDVCDPDFGCVHPPITCNDNNKCTVDTCNPSSGCVFTPQVCDDNSVCTNDECDLETGNCVFMPIVCSDGDACTTDNCHPVTGCFSTPIVCPDDGLFCNGPGCCVEGSCTQCGSPCPEGAVCDEGNDSCPQCLTAAQCADEDPCTDDACELGVCTHTPKDCSDGTVCTEDACVAGTCTHTPIDCNDNDACTTESCDPQAGCVYTEVVCTDNDACTSTTCDPQSGCVSTPVDCNDNNACTTESCDPQAGCVYAPVDCNDGDPCTIDSCDPQDECSHAPIVCNDGKNCTEDTCVGGQCQFIKDDCCTDDDCDDSDPCTTDLCDSATGAFLCDHDPVTGLPPEGGDCAPGTVCPACADGQDNDCDGLIDCLDDTVCLNPTRPNLCPRIINDPGSIRFVVPGAGGRGRINISGKLPITPITHVHPLVEEVAFVLTNANGRVFAAAVIPGDLIPNKLGNSFKFNDRDARQTGGRRFGLERLKIRTRADVIPFRFRAYADLSAATAGPMSLQVYIGDDSYLTTLNWVATSNGLKIAGGQEH